MELRTVRCADYGAAAMRLIVARCSVEYSGRLSARLPEALRLVMLKADGSVLVHADAGGFKPLNWMTPPTVVEEGDGRIVVRKLKGEDRLDIELAEVVSDVTHTMDFDAAQLEKDGVEARSAGSCWPTRRSGAARASVWSGASGRPTSGRST